MNLQDFLHGIRARLCFGPRVFREVLRISMQNFQKQIAYMDSLRKNSQIQKKKNRLNRSLYEGDIANLKSALFLENFVTARKWK